MNLDPTASLSLQVLAAAGVCFWMAAIGAPLAHAAFGSRPRVVWPFYAPILGVVAVLLATNLSAYVAPGEASAWFGLLAPSVLSAAVAWRGGVFWPASRLAVLGLLALVATSLVLFVFALANRTQTWFVDESWHFALAQRMARGVFPPVTPYGVDAGIGYHYGPDLLAASIVGTAGTPVWTAFYVLMSFLAVTLILAAVGFARDLGAPPPLAAGTGAAVGFFAGGFRVGLPPYVESTQEADGLAGFLAGLAPATTAQPASRVAFEWIEQPQWTLAIAIVILVAAALEAGVGRRHAAVLAASAGVSALAEASVLLFSFAALGAVGAVRLVRVPGRQRFTLAAALLVAAVLIALAGGPISDALFDRGGTTGMVRLELDLKKKDLAPLSLAGPTLVQVGVIPLVALAAVAALRRKSWGLAYLSAAAAIGLLEAESLRSIRPANDQRILWLATAVAMFAALTGLGALVGGLSRHRKALAVLAIGVLAMLPAVVPRAISGTQLALRGIEIRNVVEPDARHRYQARTQFAQRLAEDWDFYARLADLLPNHARLLTMYPASSASLAGVASPTSGRGLQVVSPVVAPVYEDAMRFLHRDDLQAMAITHLHVTDTSAAALIPSARRLLDDPRHFRQLDEMRSVSGRRHRVYEVLPDAGTRQVEPSSYRSLRQAVSADVPVAVARGLSTYQRRMILFTLIENDDLRAPASTFFDRATRVPRFSPTSSLPERGVVVLPDLVEPTSLRQSLDDAIWVGHGMRAYDLELSGWSTVWRIGPDIAGLPAHVRPVCESAVAGRIDLRLLGQPGTSIVAGLANLDLIGIPQNVPLDVAGCEALVLAADADLAPFAQLRIHRPSHAVRPESRIAGLGFDGGTEAGQAVVNLWYRNPQELPFETGTELRLYRADSMQIVSSHANPRNSIRWWSGPLFLAPELQTARIEFDARRLEVNGVSGVGGDSGLELGETYLLMLNVAGADPRSGYAEVQQQVPLVRVVIGDEGVFYEVFSGIVALEHRAPGTLVRRPSGEGWLGIERDLSPWQEAGASSS